MCAGVYKRNLCTRGAGTVAAAAGGVVSTADDMTNWLRFHLNGGKNENGSQVVDNEFLQRTYQSEQVTIGDTLFLRPEIPVTDVRDTYGLAWWKGFYRGM